MQTWEPLLPSPHMETTSQSTLVNVPWEESFRVRSNLNAWDLLPSMQFNFSQLKSPTELFGETYKFVQNNWTLSKNKVEKITSHRKRHIYTCNHDWAAKISTKIFDVHKIETLTASQQTFSDDILVNAYDRYNRNKKCQNTPFLGKRVVFDGESFDFKQNSPNVYYVGRPLRRPTFLGQVTCIYGAMFMIFPMNLSPSLLLYPRTKKSKEFLVYAQSHCVRHRQIAFDMIVNLARANGLPNPHALGPCVGSHPELYISKNPKKFWKNNIHTMTDYRFTLAMENTVRAGYITEKIIIAFLAGTIPIYYGTEDIMSIFNPNSFIFLNISNPQIALEKILWLEQNPAEYDKMLAQPILLEGPLTLDKYFSLTTTDDDRSGRIQNQVLHMLADKHDSMA